MRKRPAILFLKLLLLLGSPLPGDGQAPYPAGESESLGISSKNENFEIQDLRKKVATFQEEKENLQKLLREKEAKINDLEMKQRKSESDIKERDDKITALEDEIKKLKKENKALTEFASSSCEILRGEKLLFSFDFSSEKEEFMKIMGRIEADLRLKGQSIPLIGTITELQFKSDPIKLESRNPKSIFFPRWNRVASSTFFLVNLEEEIRRVAKLSKRGKEIMVFYASAGEDWWLFQGGKPGHDVFGNCISLVNPKTTYQIPGLSLIILMPYQATGTPVLESFRKFLAGEIFP